MTRRFIEWTPDDDPAEIIEIHDAGDWQTLRDLYAGGASCKPLDRIIEIAQEHGVVCVLQERRYIDLDFRSEHSRFYSTTFQRFPSVCHRLHFFTRPVASDLSNLEALRDDGCYRGYSVMRPLEKTPVGRTMIAPPPELTSDANVCVADDRVHVFGVTFEISAMPFMSQDAQYLRCAHAAQWMVLYHAHLRYGLARSLPADIHDASMGGLIVGRQVPSEGLSFVQILASLQALGLSPSKIALPQTRLGSRTEGSLSLPSILCRYVNSDLPPIVVSTSHAWVVIGYRLDGPGTGHDRVTLYRHDDAYGPYIRVNDPWSEPLPEHKPWTIAIPPLPQKAYVSAERAELLGQTWINAVAAQGVEGEPLHDALAKDRLSVRTYLIGSNDYKKRVLSTGMPAEIANLYRLSHWPRYVWVVEAQDRDLRATGRSVLGEAIIDATAHQLAWITDPALLALHTEGRAAATGPDFRDPRAVTAPGFAPYESASPAAR